MIQSTQLQQDSFMRASWGRQTQPNRVESKEPPMHFAVPTGDDLKHFQTIMQNLNQAFETFENTYTQFYNDYQEGSITKEQFVHGVSQATLPYGKVEGDLTASQSYKELVAHYPALGQYQGFEPGFTRDLNGMATAVVLQTVQETITPSSLQDLWSSIADAEKAFEQSGVYNPVFKN